MNETYTERMFNTSIDVIEKLHREGKTIDEIADNVNMSSFLVAALIERFLND